MNSESTGKSRMTSLCLAVGLFLFLAGGLFAAPVIAPLANVTVPAGKSLIIPITVTVTNGRPLTFTITSSTNAFAVVTHTNDPFWKLNVGQQCAPGTPGAIQIPFRGGIAYVTNVGDMTFMLFPEYAPNTVAIFQGLSDAGFYNFNTIFHRVINGFIIQGGDPLTNGTGGLVFHYNDEFNPQAIFSGNGQLALANSGENTDGSQFFVTEESFRTGDFIYTIFGQLVRGFNILTNIETTVVDANSRPLTNEIITQISMVPDTADTAITLVATNVAGVTGIISVVADDGAGGRVTNTFTAATAADASSNGQPFFFGNTVTNIAAPVNTTVTNVLNALGMDGEPLYWWFFYDSAATASNSVVSYVTTNSLLQSLPYNLTNSNGQIQFNVAPLANYTGQAVYVLVASSGINWFTNYNLGLPLPPWRYSIYTFTFGDTPIYAQTSAIAPQVPKPFANLLLATFTNGVSASPVANFTASVQWGDDTITSAVIGTNTARMKQVFGSHTYTNSGVYPIAITIQSALGVTVAVTNAITVLPPVSWMHAGPNMVVTWPAWAYGFGLQSCSNLYTPVWAGVPNTPVLSGFQNVVSNKVSPGNLFYRLKE